MLFVSSSSSSTEFDIVGVEEKCLNKSPVLYENHRIGLESWCIKYLYNFFYAKLMQLMQKSRHLIDEQKLFEYTRLVLLIHPDFSFAWNCRFVYIFLKCIFLNFNY